jgi:hypothetical protein
MPWENLVTILVKIAKDKRSTLDGARYFPLIPKGSGCTRIMGRRACAKSIQII